MLLFTLLVASVPGLLALVPPADPRDGVYRASVDASGTELHELLSVPSPHERRLPAATSASPSDPKAMFKRGWILYCGCGHNMDHGDCDAAVADLKTQFREGVKIQAHQAYYSIRGSVVAFACNLGDGQVWMTKPAMTWMAEQITGACGRYVAGTYKHADAQGAIGYMRWNPGLDFCANAMGSSAHAC